MLTLYLKPWIIDEFEIVLFDFKKKKNTTQHFKN